MCYIVCCLTVRTFLHVTIEIMLCGQRSKYVSHVCFLVLFSEQDGRKFYFKVSSLHWQYVSFADVYNLMRVDGVTTAMFCEMVRTIGGNILTRVFASTFIDCSKQMQC